MLCNIYVELKDSNGKQKWHRYNLKVMESSVPVHIVYLPPFPTKNLNNQPPSDLAKLH